MTQAILRQEKHQNGKVFMNDEDYFNAMNTFLDAIEKHGPHVGLLSDLTACFYMLGRIEDCLLTAKRLETELNQALPLLKKQNAARTLLFLGKIYEEAADVAKALSLYQRAVDVCDLEAAEIKIQAQAQLLRLKSFLGIKTELSDLYQNCNKLKTDSLYIKTELEHGLVMAEVVLFGAKMASARALNFLKHNQALPFDVRLILVDLLEECIREKISFPELAEALKFTALTNLDKFEETVLNFYTNSEKYLDAEEMTYLAKELPLMGYLRLMVINLKRIKDRDLNLELQRQLYFMIDSLDTESRSMLLRKCDLNAKQQRKEILLDLVASSISVQGKRLVLKKGSFALMCFEIFADTKSLSIDQVNEKIFSFPADTDLYDRIRVAFWRLNKELGTITGQGKTFNFSKNGVELNEQFTIIKSQTYK